MWWLVCVEDEALLEGDVASEKILPRALDTMDACYPLRHRNVVSGLLSGDS